MPGFNQKGPMNEGAMTGRGRGRCTAPSSQDFDGNSTSARNNAAYGRGQTRAMGIRKTQRLWPNEDNRISLPWQSTADKDLKIRVNHLESELEALKNQLNSVENP